jgi:Protein of unknown function (DUF3485)
MSESDAKIMPAAVEPSSAHATAAPTSRGPSTRQIAIVVAILGGSVLFTAMTSDVTKVSEPGIKLTADGQPFLTDKAGNWTGGELTGLTDVEKQILPEDTMGSRRLFQDKDGDELFCSIVLAGRDVTSIHRPELCLTGQGWSLGRLQVEQIPTPATKSGLLSVSRLDATRDVKLSDGRIGRANSIFLYWFVGKDRVTPYHWQRIYWTARDRVLHNINHRWAYILIHIPVKKNTDAGDATKSEEDTMKVVAGFVHDVYPTLVAN